MKKILLILAVLGLGSFVAFAETDVSAKSTDCPMKTECAASKAACGTSKAACAVSKEACMDGKTAANCQMQAKASADQVKVGGACCPGEKTAAKTGVQNVKMEAAKTAAACTCSPCAAANYDKCVCPAKCSDSKTADMNVAKPAAQQAKAG